MTHLRTLSAGLILLAATALRPAAAEDAPSFAGKTITMTIGFGTGGSVDLYGRILGQHLMRHLPGQPSFIVVNQLGAGGIVALNHWITNAEPNGLSVTIGAQSQTDPDALFRAHAVYDVTKFKFAGGLTAYSQGLFVRKEALARLYDKSAKPVVMGIVGSTLRSGSYQVLWGVKFLGWNVRWVRGYPSTSELRQALERGEIDMSTFGASADIKGLIASGAYAIVSQGGTVKDGRRVPRPIFGDAPILADLVKDKITDPAAEAAFDYTESVTQVGMWLALPPATPDAITLTYRKAFAETLADPAYQADFAKIDPDSVVASPGDIEALVTQLSKVSPETLKTIELEIKRQDADKT